jgi:hypothetical protein
VDFFASGHITDVQDDWDNKGQNANLVRDIGFALKAEVVLDGKRRARLEEVASTDLQIHGLWRQAAVLGIGLWYYASFLLKRACSSNSNGTLFSA